ncbi:bifunctional aspartate kinase/homoserine dehydrogenase I [soil metagenome]
MGKPVWITHKFGGTSVANAERYKHVAKLLSDKKVSLPYVIDAADSKMRNTAIVVSAMSKVTDALIELTTLARHRDNTYLTKLEAIKLQHLKAVDELLPLSERASLQNEISKDVANLVEILKSVWHVQSCSEQIVEFISGHGEIWSAQMLNAYLNSIGEKSAWLDAREVLIVEPGETSVVVDWPQSQSKLDAWLAKNPVNKIVITGFIASTKDGVPTTLKRNGSDYSAAIFGKLLKSESITIWTDVDGVLSADPRLVPEAVVLPDLSYHETSELAYFGAKVVHPSTMAPAIQDAIPIWIRNTFNPAAHGTKIHTTSTSSAPVKGFATVDNVSLINVEGSGMMGVPGVAQRLFGALREVGISVIMISQASSEHSICFAIPSLQTKAAKKAVANAFVVEIASGLIQSIETNEDCSILAAVGDNMANQPGIAGKFLSALGRANVNIRAIAQGSSERNISVVVSSLDSMRALRAVHSGFFLSNHTISIGIIGTGGIGATLLKQLHEETNRLRDEFKIDLRVRGLANSTRMRLSKHAGSLEKEFPLANWKEDFAANSQPLDIDRFAQHIHPDYLPHAVLIDCTSNESIADHYPAWLKQGIHIITPNKKGNTGSMESYRELKRISRSDSHHYLYETTVGAGLPIINTLRELIQTGDRLHSIEGVLSGTLSYIFNTFSVDRPFSEVVLEAKAKGYTEPDPREDLSGLDVARKLVILAREAGISIELKDVSIEALLPADLQTGSVDEFLKKLPTQDARMLQLAVDAKSKGEVLRYVGTINEGKASIVLRRYPSNHPFAQTQSTDNIVAFRTARYSKQPLIVQGPGAGPEVTAAGVFADILRLSSYLGAPL